METVGSGSGEENTAVKPAKPSIVSQEKQTPTTSPYPEWPAPMQAYYGAGSTQPPFFPSAVAGPSPYPYLWGGQHLVSPYGTPIPYPAMYPHGGLYPHPNMTMAQGAAITSAQMEGKDTSVKKIKSSGNIGLVGGKSKESANGASGSGNDGVSQSAESGSEGSSDASEENFNHKGISEDKKRSFDQMLADGNPTGDTTTTSLNMGMDVWNASPVGTVPLRGRSNTPGVLPAVAPVTRAGHEGLGTDHLWVQDERELKRQRRKLSNRESARRSRLRKQAECEELQVKVEALSDENHSLRKELERIYEERQKLTNENTSLVGELTQLYGEDVISTIKSKNDTGSVPPSGSAEGVGVEQDTSGGNNSVSG